MRGLGWLGGAVLGTLLAVSRAAQAAPPLHVETEAEKRERATLLSQVLPNAVRARDMPALPPLLMSMGILEGGLGIGAKEPKLIVSGAVLFAGTSAFYFVSERRNYELVSAMASVGLAGLYLALPFSSNDRYPGWQVGLGAGYLTSAALGFVNMAYSTNPGLTRLRADLRRVATPAGRAGLSQGELFEVERDLYATDPFIPNWLQGLPVLLGAAYTLTPVFDADVPKKDKGLPLAFGALTLLGGVGRLFVSTPADEYRRSLSHARLWVTWTPTVGGISVLGGFD